MVLQPCLLLHCICAHLQVNASSSVVDAAVMGLQLDELELASLRGEVQEVSLRFSGLQGEALSAGVRWERDVIRLEKAVLQQLGSRYAPHVAAPCFQYHSNVVTRT